MIEILIAMLLTSIAVIGVVGLYLVATRSGSDSNHTTEAAVLAEDKMEVIRTMATPSGGTETGLDSLGHTATTNNIYSRTWTATIAATTVSYTVTVSWTEDGPTKSVVLRSMRSYP